MDSIQDTLPAGDSPTTAEDLAVLLEPEKKLQAQLRPLSQAAVLAAQSGPAERIETTRPVIRPSQLPKYLTNETNESIPVRLLDGAVRTILPGDVLVDEAGLPVKIPDMYKYRQERGIPNPLILYRVTARMGGKIADPVEVDALDESDAIRQTCIKLGVQYTHQWTFKVFVVAK